MSASSPTPSYVLLHGFAGRPESWQGVLDALPAGTRTLAPEIHGHGPANEGANEGAADSQIAQGRAPNEGAADSQIAQKRDLAGGFEAEVDRLAGVISAKGFSGSHLVGYSLGGRLALGLLLRHGHLFRAASLLGTHPGLATEEERRQRRRKDEAWARRLEAEGLEAFLDAWEAQPLFSTQTGAQRADQRRMRQGLDPHGLARALRELSLGRMPGYRSRLPELTVPVCWAAGELDPKFRALAAACAAETPGSRRQILPGAGHNVVLERPAAVAELLQRPSTSRRVTSNALEGSLK